MSPRARGARTTSTSRYAGSGTKRSHGVASAAAPGVGSTTSPASSAGPTSRIPSSSLAGVESPLALLDRCALELDRAELDLPTRELGLLGVDSRLSLAELASELDEIRLTEVEVALTQAKEPLDRGSRVSQPRLARLEIRERLLDDRRLLGKLAAALGEELLESLLGARVVRQHAANDSAQSVGRLTRAFVFGL